MLDWLRGLFSPPIEVAGVKDEIEALLAEIAPIPAGIIRQDAATVMKHRGVIIQAVRRDGQVPADIALRLVTKALSYRLTSGDFHAERGTLNLVGKELKRAWLAAMERALRQGFCSREDIDKALARLEQGIAIAYPPAAKGS